MANESIHETPAEKAPHSVESKPISAELKAKQERVNAIAKDLLSKFPKDERGKIPPEIGQVVTAAAWAIERGELKQEDIAEITDINELSARVESSKPTVEKKVSPELYAAQQSVNAISKEITEALGGPKMTKELNAQITSAAWLIQKQKLTREYLLKDLVSPEDFTKRLDEYRAREPEIDGIKKPTPELNQQAMRAAWLVNKGGISREELLKDIKSVAELKARVDAIKTPAKSQDADTPER